MGLCHCRRGERNTLYSSTFHRGFSDSHCCRHFVLEYLSTVHSVKNHVPRLCCWFAPFEQFQFGSKSTRLSFLEYYYYLFILTVKPAVQSESEWQKYETGGAASYRSRHPFKIQWVRNICSAVMWIFGLAGNKKKMP